MGKTTNKRSSGKKGLKVEDESALSVGKMDMDEHLKLKELEKKSNYDERDLV